tara:strand:- start:235 stop:1023 length:789 start_codon:yes stop_codon:yes gene_type:complete
MYTHNLDPILFNLGFVEIRWYSLAYIFGILIGWWLGKVIILKRFQNQNFNFDIKEFDNLITYIIISILLGGRVGYILFYNFGYYLSNPFDTLKIWEGGMSFHGALAGVILGTYWFSIKKNIPVFFLLDTISFVAPIGIFFGRIANFINGELVGKTTDVFWGVIFPMIDNNIRHPSQLYEAFLEGLVLFIIMNLTLFRNNYKTGTCSYIFLIYYGIFRIFSEFYREPDLQIGYFFNLISMGMILSILMILAGVIIFFKKDDIK